MESRKPAYLGGTAAASGSAFGTLSTPANLGGTAAASGSAFGTLSTPANLAGTAAAFGGGSAHLSVPPPMLAASGTSYDPIADPIAAAPAVVESERRLATSADYGLVLVPLTVAGHGLRGHRHPYH